jgi:hypothetical protein
MGSYESRPGINDELQSSDKAYAKAESNNKNCKEIIKPYKICLEE